MLVVPILVPVVAPEATLAVDSMSFVVLACTILCCIAALAIGARRHAREPNVA